uniref:NOT2_3_5 domain-containing protein n=1 Tax=Mesocestoides corti TaxID=53468 RepID=A0A5K3F0Q5_MESCO
MAGIGQLGMGRTMHNDTQKNLSTFQASADKRPLLNNASGASSLSGLGPGIGLNYTPRPSSSTRIKGLTSTGGSFRSNYAPDSALDSVAVGFLPYGSNSTFSGPPQRGLSEPSLLSGLGNFNHPVNPDLSTLMSGLVNSSKASLIGMGNVPNKSLTSIGLMGNSGNTSSSGLMNPGVSSSGLTFDPSDFPPIVNSINQSQNQGFPGNPQHRNYVSAIAKGGGSGVPSSLSGALPSQNSFSGSAVQASPEFSIDQDFPALPVAQTSSISTTTVNSAPLPSVVTHSSNQSTHSLTVSSGEALKSQAASRAQRSQSGGSSHTEPASGGSLELLNDHYVANIPRDMIFDQYGMIGLLKLIQIDPTFEPLAPGLNLASMGISHWLPPGELYTRFASPVSDSCMLRPQDMDFNVPPEYQIRHQIANRLPHDPQLELLSDEILFWLFYNCCREEVQLVAAKELYNREWRFHKKKQRWITRIVGSDIIRDANSEQGAYYYWDPVSAEKLTQHMSICYADLDETPTTYRLTSSTLNASVQPVAAPQHQLYHHHNQQQHLFNSSNLSGSSPHFAAAAVAGRIPRPVAMAPSTGTKLGTSVIPNGPVVSQLPVAKQEAKANEGALSNPSVTSASAAPAPPSASSSS